MLDATDAFARKLSIALKALNLSRVQVAALVEVDKSAVGRWLRATTQPSDYNLARLSAFKDDPRQAGIAAAEAMGAPWLADRETLAATLDLGTMGRLGLVILLNALEGYHDQQAPLQEVVFCAARPPPPAAPGAAIDRPNPLTAAVPDAMLGS